MVAHKRLNLAALKGRADAIRLRREVAELMSDVEIAAAPAGSPRLDDGALIFPRCPDLPILSKRADWEGRSRPSIRVPWETSYRE